MSPSNPNTKTNATSDLSLNTLIQEALEKQSIPLKPQRTPSIKRKTQDQNSAEKTKPSKINNATNSQISPQLIQRPLAMSNANPTKPKMLRQDPKTLSGIPCVSAHYTREAILTKDAIHPPPYYYYIIPYCITADYKSHKGYLLFSTVLFFPDFV